MELTEKINDKWQELKGRAKEKWNQLTDDEFDIKDEKMDDLAKALQKKYGLTKEKAEEEVKKFSNEHYK